MKNAFASILTGLLATLAIQAVSAQIRINDMWVECDKGELFIHCNFDIAGHMGKDCEFISYFFLGENGIKDRNGLFRTKKGCVSASTRFMPVSDKRTYDDFIVSIPITELHVPAGVIDEEPIFVANRIGIRFGIMHKDKFLYLSDESETYYFDLSYVNCVLCLGGGHCFNCSGTGKDPIEPEKNCTHCKKSGICPRCKGSGTEAEYPVQCVNLGTTKENPRIDTSVTTWIQTDEITPTDIGPDKEPKASDTHSGACPGCGGKGFEPKIYRYASGSHMPVYHNFQGMKCFVCGEYTEHYHYKCSHCRKY